MPLAVADLLDPKGRISAHLFPGDSAAALIARATEYLAQGNTVATARALAGASADDFARLWSYYLAFDAAATRLAHTPASATRNDQGGMSYLGSQIAEARRQADGFRAEAEVIVAVAARLAPAPTPSPSVAVPVAYTW